LNINVGDCQNNLFSDYQNFINEDPNNTKKNVITIASIIRDRTPDLTLRKVVFSSLYLNSYNGVLFETYGNNFSGVKLTEKWAGSLPNGFENGKYYCSSKKIPYAIFENEEKNIDFQIARYKDKINSMSNDSPQEISKFLILNTDPKTKQENVYNELDNKTKQKIEDEVKKAIQLYDTTL
jgi:hypothetical protein